MARIPLAGALARHDLGHPQEGDIAPKGQLRQTKQLKAKDHCSAGASLHNEGMPLYIDL